MNSLLPNLDLLKKVGKTTRPFRYDINQTPYDYTVEVRNRFNGLALIECLMNYGRRFVTLYRKLKDLHHLKYYFLFYGDGLDPCLLYNVTNLHP